MRSRVLVVGATGMLGAPVARQLANDGWTVRCLVRDVARARALLGDAFEFVPGDVTQPTSLDAAFDGCSAVHLNLRGGNTIDSYQRVEVEGAAHCIQAARRHGLSRVTYLSGSGRSSAELERHFPVRVKRAVEAALSSGRVAWTSFRATHFFESLPMFVRDGRATVLGTQPHELHYVAARDYARMVSRALDEPAAASRALHVWGPEAFTMRQALMAYVAVHHPRLRVGRLPIPLARLIARLTGNRDLAFACDLFAAFADIGEAGDPAEANSLLGAPVTTLEQWLAQPLRETAA